MGTCYHKEAFAIGMVIALFIAAIFHIFEDVVKNWLKRLMKIV